MKQKDEQKIKKEAEVLEETLTADIADAQAMSDTEKDDEFKKLIKGEFKNQFERRIKENLDRRFKELSTLKEKAQKEEKIIGAIMEKYGIENYDSDAILSAIKEDGISPSDETDPMQKLQKEYDLMKEKNDALTMAQKVKEWMKDGGDLKESYPDFDIRKEAENPEFMKLLKSGIGLKNAYLAMHHDSIVKNLVEKAAKEAQEKTAESIIKRNQRPLENGIGSKSAALFKTDVSKLTPSQRAEIAKRVSRGEIISF